MKKVNGCLPRTQDRLVLDISPDLVAKDVSYWSRHALICKFLGIHIPLSSLEAWIQRSWQIEGDLEIMLAANSYFMVIFSNMADRNRVFEGGPYFYNQVGLFIKPWHASFNSAEEMPSRVPVWVRLPRLPLEFWREDILHKIASLMGKSTGVATQTLDKKVISFARICLEIDLNNPLPDSMEICLGSSSWIQQLDYESLPFQCRFCHEYGHLLRQCPKVRKEAHSPSSAPPPMGKEDKGKAPMMEEPQGKDKEGFVPVKTKAKGQGQKRTFKDRQLDGGFNGFEVLENLALEGVPHVVTYNSVGVSMEVVPVLEPEPTQAIQGQQVPQVTLNNSMEDDIVLADLAREVLASSQNKRSSHRLGVQQRPLKKGPVDSSSKGQKTDLEKIKMTGDLLVESGFVKPIDAHFSQTPPLSFSLGM